MTERFTLHHGDCLEVLRGLDDCSVDAIVTDPPAGIAFMSRDWDKDKGGRTEWVAWMREIAAECLRVIKPGGHALVWAIPRTSHWTGAAWEDAGWQPRDKVYHVFGSGFPKSLDISKSLDKMDAAQEQQARRYRFTAWVRSTGVTSRQIDEATGTKMGSHYTTHPTQPAIMTREHLEACRHLLGDIPPWVEREADIRSVESKNFKAREVVGQTKQGRLAVAPGQDNDRSVTKMNITAPATDAAKQWQGWGTALKPAAEEWWLFRKPLTGTVAANVLEWGTGGLNVDGCRVGNTVETWPSTRSYGTKAKKFNSYAEQESETQATGDTPSGRWPANFTHDGSDEVVGLFPERDGAVSNGSRGYGMLGTSTFAIHNRPQKPGRADTGSAARFFYCAKASRADRNEGCEGLQERLAMRYGEKAQGPLPQQTPSKPVAQRNHHPTVKPTSLMRWLCRLITPPGGVVLDPFTGSGSTGKAAMLEGMRFIGIEREAEYIEIARARISHAAEEPQQSDLFS